MVFELITNYCSLEYIFLCLRTRNLNSLRNQNTQPLITGTLIKNEFVPLPNLKTQQEIVEFLHHHTSEIDKEVSLEERRIELLKEYRQSLISEVVTGKINVTDYAN